MRSTASPSTSSSPGPSPTRDGAPSSSSSAPSWTATPPSGGGRAAKPASIPASDGPTPALIMGLAEPQTEGKFVLLAGVAGLLAGAFSMAAGEYVSMRAQREL